MKSVRVGIEAGLACSPRPTGVEYYARSLLEAMLEQIPPWVEVHLYLPPGGENYVKIPSQVKAHFRPDFNTALKGLWLVTRSWRDRLHLVFSFGHQLSARCRGYKVVTIHDTIFMEYPEFYPPGAAENARREVAQALRWSHAVATPSETTTASLRRYFASSLPTFVVRGAPREGFCPGPGEPVEGIEPPFFLFVGRMDRRKNLLGLVRAYRRLLLAGNRCTLVLVGPADSGSAELAHLLAGDQVEGEQVVLPGYLPEWQLVNLYRQAVAFIYPSLAEGGALPVLEAMACGAPTVTSNCSALGEFGGPAAYLVDPLNEADLATAMEELLLSQQLRSKMQADGLTLAHTYTWRAAAKSLWTGLQTLLQPGDSQ